MNEIIENNFEINCNENQKDIYKIISKLESNENMEISNDKEYSIEEIKITDNNGNNNNNNIINVNKLESIRFSLIDDQSGFEPQILLDRMVGDKYLPTKGKIGQKNELNKNENKNKFDFQKNIKENEYKINMINAINTNKGLDIVNDNNNFEENTIHYYDKDIYVNEDEDEDENENEDDDEERLLKKKCREQKKILKKQNELFVQLLNNTDGDNDNCKKRIISNLNKDLTTLTTNNESQTKKNDEKNNNKNNNKNIQNQKYLNKNNSLKQLNNKIIKIPINFMNKSKKINKHHLSNRKKKENIIHSNNNNIIGIKKNCLKLNNYNSTKVMNINKSKLNIFNNNFTKNFTKTYLTSENLSRNRKNVKQKNLNENLINSKTILMRNKSLKSIFLTDKNICDYYYNNKNKSLNQQIKKNNNNLTYNNYQSENKIIKKNNSSNNKMKKIKNPKENNKYSLNKKLNKKIYKDKDKDNIYKDKIKSLKTIGIKYINNSKNKTNDEINKNKFQQFFSKKEALKYGIPIC